MKFGKYLRSRIGNLILLGLCTLIFAVVFFSYDLPAKVLAYPFILCAILILGWGAADYLILLKKHRRLEELQKAELIQAEDFPGGSTIPEEDYQKIVLEQQQKKQQLETQMNTRFRDTEDYYTAWVHQVKTPIAAMYLHLQDEDSELARKLNSDLFRIEQYVDMALNFLRLDSDSTDYVLRKEPMGPMIRQSIRKFAGEFVSRKIRLNYEPVQTEAVTDEKWFVFVLCQILSNALKYTNQGTITIREAEPGVLCIADTGIGIAAEDLPRIFDKGYTGYNGRSDKKATGLGLYLCRKVCDRLGHGIRAESEAGKGTTVYIDVRQQYTRYE